MFVCKGKLEYCLFLALTDQNQTRAHRNKSDLHFQCCRSRVLLLPHRWGGNWKSLGSAVKVAVSLSQCVMAKLFSVHGTAWLLEGVVAVERKRSVLTKIIFTEAFQDLPGSAGLLKLTVLAAGSGHCCNRNEVIPPLSSFTGKGTMKFWDLQVVACCLLVMLLPKLPRPRRGTSDRQGGKY